jgi:hypothetical protein
VNCLPGLTSICDPADLCLLSKQDNRNEPSVPGYKKRFNLMFLSSWTVVFLIYCCVCGSLNNRMGE